MTTQGTETRQGQDLQGLGAKHDGPVGTADAPQPTDNAETIMTDVQQAVPVAGEHYRHVKRSTVYEVVGLASLQNANQAVLPEAACLVIYRGDDGNLWAREGGEFMDGRFALTEPARKADRLGEGVVAWCSPGQLANLMDVDIDGGVYLPIRKTERGNFTMPLYSHPAVLHDPTHTREAEDERLRQALEDICNPLAYLQRMAEADGNRLSGMAYTIANDINTVQGIARAALSAGSAQ
jgi:hypothetical protein